MTEECSNNNHSNDRDTDDVAMNRDEFIISHTGPALLANRFFIARGPWGIRLAFAEQLRSDIPAEFRNAVVLSQQDAISLYKCLQSLVNDTSDQIKLISDKELPDDGPDAA